MGHIHEDLFVAAFADTETKHHTRSVLSRRIGGRAYHMLSPGVRLSVSHVVCNQSTTHPARSPGRQDTCSLVDRFCAPSCHGRCRASPVPCRSPTQPRSLGVAPSTAQSPSCAVVTKVLPTGRSCLLPALGMGDLACRVTAGHPALPQSRHPKPASNRRVKRAPECAVIC